MQVTTHCIILRHLFEVKLLQYKTLNASAFRTHYSTIKNQQWKTSSCVRRLWKVHYDTPVRFQTWAHRVIAHTFSLFIFQYLIEFAPTWTVEECSSSEKCELESPYTEGFSWSQAFHQAIRPYVSIVRILNPGRKSRVRTEAVDCLTPSGEQLERRRPVLPN